MVQSSNPINNSVGAEISGVTNSFTVFNDSDTASSQARTIIATGGTSAGDPWLNFKINGTTDWSVGIDNDDSDIWKLSQGNALGTNDTLIAYTTGEVVRPRQPAFKAFLTSTQSNFTGDGTSVTIPFDSIASPGYNIGTHFDTGTSAFTCPVDGIYLFTSRIFMQGVTSSHTQGIWGFTSSGTFKLSAGMNANFANLRVSGGDEFIYQVVSQGFLEAGDEVTVTGEVSNGAKVVDVNGTTNRTFFVGSLIG